MLQYDLFLILAPISIVVLAFTMMLSWRYLAASENKSFSWTIVCLTGYLVVNLLELVNPAAEGTLFLAKLNIFFIAFIPVAWLTFALEYTRYTEWLKSRSIWLLCSIPVITVVLTLSNEMHHLIWVKYSFMPVRDMLVMKVAAYGYWFWIHVIYAYSVIAFSTFIIARRSFSLHYIYRYQSILVVIATVIPVAANFVYISHVFPGWSKDYSPIAFAVAGFLILIGIARFRLFELSPIARDTLFDRMSEGLLVLDGNHCVVDINPSALKSLHLDLDKAVGISLEQILPLSGYDLIPEDSDEKSVEICIEGSDGTPALFFDVITIRLVGAKGSLLGYLVTIYNTTPLKELLQKVEELARTDSLTGLSNRRYMFEQVNLELERSRRHNTSFSILLMDVDNFKTINDTYGHQVGDEVLKMVAQRICKSLRSIDVIARYGGDEFFALLPEIDNENVHTIAERVLSACSSQPIPCTKDGSIHVTLSMGICCVSHAGTKVNLEQMLEYADKAMYRSKTDGRNRYSLLDYGAVLQDE